MNCNIILRPWAEASAAGRRGFAILLFFMQVSLVFWPAAVRAAQRLEVERQKQALLDGLAAAHARRLGNKGLFDSPIGLNIAELEKI